MIRDAVRHLAALGPLPAESDELVGSLCGAGGRILRALFVRSAPLPAPEARVVLALDSSPIPRPYV